MRRVLLVIAFLCATQAAVASSTIPAKGTIEVAFSPNGGATALVVKTIAGAKKSILVQAYSFTSAQIAKALVEARARGVDVRVILDKSQKSERYTSATYLANHGVPVWIDAAHAIAHNKVIVFFASGQYGLHESEAFAQAEQLKNSKDKVEGRF